MKKNKQSLAIIVGTNITMKRKSAGMNQAQLAELLDIGPDSLSRIERGLTAPRFNTLEKISDVLKCHVAELFMTGSEGELLSEKDEGLTTEDAMREIVFMAEKILRLARTN